MRRKGFILYRDFGYGDFYWNGQIDFRSVEPWRPLGGQTHIIRSLAMAKAFAALWPGAQVRVI